MNNILQSLEELIDNIERDNTLTKEDILKTVYKIKNEVEEIQLSEDSHSLDWGDLD